MPLYLYACPYCCWTERHDVEVKSRNEKQWCQACRKNSLARKGWALRPEGWHVDQDGFVTIRKEMNAWSM
jgi:predicted nucleic acid-binding Zn ribbon protein